ncbi:MAG: hypothetical protein RLY21_525 [Planctomycetota bacterium]|jgi:tetratricopeptide (TPR) repeat protein
MMDETSTTDSAREALARVRLEELQALARTYRNWSVKELAIALGRQPGRLVPESGMPKIDLVVALAKALDWPIEAVVEHLVKPETALRSDAAAGDTRADFATLYSASLDKRLSRDYFEAIRLAVRAGAVADTPTRRAAASMIESDAHEACGSYLEALRCLRAAAQIDGVELAWRLLIDAKCANILFMQGNRTQAIGSASSVLEYTARIEADHVARLARALALWARAHALRASIPVTSFEPWQPLAASAEKDFETCAEISEELRCSAHGYQDRNLTFATAVDVAILELRAVRDPEFAPAAIARLLEVVREGGDVSPGVSERKAWAAIALANTAKRSVTDDMQLWGMLELSSAALRAHASATSNWYFAHQHLELDSERRRRLGSLAHGSRLLDATEAKLVAGVLGHVPAARSRADDYFALYATREASRP